MSTAGNNGVMGESDRSMFATATSSSDRYQLNTFGFGTHQAIIALIRNHSRVLDVGCADGSLGALLRRDREAMVTGVEADPVAAAAAASQMDHVITGDVADPAVLTRLVAAGPFDQVVLGDVLEHTERPDVVLESLLQLLEPDGSVVVSLPNILTLSARMRLLRGVWKYEDSGPFDRTHLRFFSVASARELVAQAGLAVVNEIDVGPFSHRLGRRGTRLTALRPGLLATQVIIEAKPSGPQIT